MTQGSVSALTHLRQCSVRWATLQGTGAIDCHKAGKRVAGRPAFDVRHLFAIEDGYLHFTRTRHVDPHPLCLQRQLSDQPGVVCVARPGKGLWAMCVAKNPKRQQWRSLGRDWKCDP